MKQVWEFLKQTIEKDTTIVLGLSGGPDSMCLFSLLLQLREEYRLKIIVAHVNHHVRKESDAEEIFVKQKANETGCIFESISLNFANSLNFEAEARKKRYDFFKAILKKYQAHYLMTAHHGDDLIETILMRISRGSNLNGYVGFSKLTKYKEYTLVRPLVYVTKKDILDFCQKENISYCIDFSNESDCHTRNRYRKNILPFLKQENQKVHLKYLKFSEEMNSILEYLQKTTRDALTKTMSFDKVNLHELNRLEPIIKKRVIEYILKEEYQDDIDKIQSVHVDSILKLCDSKKANGSIDLPLNKKIIKEYNLLYFAHKETISREEYILENGICLNEQEKIIKIASTDIEKSNYILRLNSKEIKLPLKVRTRKITDRMQVKNMEGEKKISKIFIDEKVPLRKRENYPIVVDSNETILWLPGLKKSKFDKNKDEFYDIIYKYEIKKEDFNEK